MFQLRNTVFTLNVLMDRPEKSANLDQMPQNVPFEQGLHCLPFIQLFLDIRTDSKMVLIQILVLGSLAPYCGW